MNVLDVFRAGGTQLYWRRMADEQVIGVTSGSMSGAAIEADRAYFVLRLAEMYLGRSRTLWRKAYPMVHGFTSYRGREEHSVAGPSQLQDIGGGHLDRMIVLNRRLAGPTPFRGGDVTLLVGLWSVPGDDVAKALVSTVTAVSGLVGATGTPVAQVVDLVKSSVETIFGLDDTVLRLGVDDTFFSGNPLRAGYYVGIGAPAAAVDPTVLWLRDGHLVSGRDPLVARPYEQHDYLVVQVERRDVRDDWPALPGIGELNQRFASVMAATEPAAEKRSKLYDLWPAFVQKLAGSEHLTAAHAQKIQADVAADLAARLDALEHGNPFETKAWGSERVEARRPEDFDLAEVPDYVTVADMEVGAVGEAPPPTFGAAP